MGYNLINKEDDLNNLLNEFVDKAQNIVIQAGHFALIMDKQSNRLIPAIYNDIDNTETINAIKSNPYMGEFPTKTWELALKIISKNLIKNIKISIIVNDWQWVPKSLDGKANELRREFYDTHLQVPKSFNELMIKYGMSNDILLPLTSDKHSFLYFGEQKMRNIAKRKFSDIDSNSSAVSCAIGYLPFLNYVDQQNIDLLISFIPRSCKEPINFGTEHFLEYHSTNTTQVVNIFCGGMNTNNFFEQSEVETFNQ